jgi:hypothetical protein
MEKLFSTTIRTPTTLVTLVVMVLFAMSVSSAEVSKSVQLRPGDTVFGVLTANGVSARSSMELLSSKFISTRMDAVRDGSTVEFVVENEQLVRIHVSGPLRGTFNAWLGRAGGWQADESAAPAGNTIASQIRRLEARGINQRVNARRIASTEADSPRSLALVVQRAEREASSRLAANNAVRAINGSAQRVVAGRNVNATSDVPKPQPKPKPVPKVNLPTPVVAAAPQQPRANVTSVTATAASGTGIAGSLSVAQSTSVRSSASTPETTIALLDESGAGEARVGGQSAPQSGPKPRLEVDAESLSPAACPTIAGAWVAAYDHFDCEAQVSFSMTAPGVFEMKQDGCGDIAGSVSLDGRSVSGNWEHLVCEGVLNLQLDETCQEGVGTWQANEGKALCPDKPYAVTITRGSVDPKAKRSKRTLTLFGGAAPGGTGPSGDR